VYFKQFKHQPPAKVAKWLKVDPPSRKRYGGQGVECLESHFEDKEDCLDVGYFSRFAAGL
jgi:hypothetical protein